MIWVILCHSHFLSRFSQICKFHEKILFANKSFERPEFCFFSPVNLAGVSLTLFRGLSQFLSICPPPTWTSFHASAEAAGPAVRLWTVVFVRLCYHPGIIGWSIGWSIGCSLLRRYRLDALLISIKSEMGGGSHLHTK